MKKLIEKRENSILNTSPLSNQLLNLKLGLMPNINSGIKVKYSNKITILMFSFYYSQF